MTELVPPPNPDLPNSAETVAILDLEGLIAEQEPGTPTRPVRKTSSAPPPRPRPSPHRKQLLQRIAFLLALLLCLGWGVMQVRDLKRQPAQRLTGGGAAVVNPSPAPSPPELPADQPAAVEIDPEESYPGLRASTFLRTHVWEVDLKRDDGDGTNVVLDDVVVRQAVTVVNLWATWCDPCKDEFSGFQSMFILNRRDRGWGKETRFVPILVDDAENKRGAYRTWKNDMPEIHAALIDLKFDQGGVRNALAQIDKLAPKESLPITLLFDCLQRIRWSKMGALDEAAFVTLANEIDGLREELHQDKCRHKRPPPLLPSAPPPDPTDPPVASAVAPVKKKPCSSRRTCEGSEDCSKRCCSCPDDVVCRIRPDGLGICPEKL